MTNTHATDIATTAWKPHFQPLPLHGLVELYDIYPPLHVVRVYHEWVSNIIVNTRALDEAWRVETRSPERHDNELRLCAYSAWKLSQGLPRYIPQQREISLALDELWFSAYVHKSEDVAQALRKMPYGDYLKTYHWRVVRFGKILLGGAECSGYRCRERSREPMWDELHNLHIHHKTYENRGSEKPCDLISLCADCHRIEHFGDE